MLRLSNKLIDSSLKRKPPSLKRKPIFKQIKNKDPAYFTVACATGFTGLGLTYLFEKYQPNNKTKLSKWFGKKDEKVNATEKFYNRWKEGGTGFSVGLICGFPILVYLSNTAAGLNITKQLTNSQNALGYSLILNRIIKKRGNGSNIFYTSVEIYHRTFSHSGAIHLALNTYLAYNLIDISSSSSFDRWDFRQLSAAFFGGLFSSALAAKLGQLGLGLSGGVYSILGYYFASGGLDHVYFNIIFDIEGKYPFSLQDFGSKWIPFETVLAGLQVLKYQFSPIGHVGHVVGFFYGVLMYYIYQECHRPGYIEMIIRENQNKLYKYANEK